MTKDIDVRNWFGLKKMPFTSDISTKDIFIRESIQTISRKIRFSVQNSFYYVVIGEVGSGKTTALRFALSQLPPKQYEVLSIVAGNRSFSELMRQVAGALGAPTRAFQGTTILRYIYEGYASLRESGLAPVLFIDEAHLLPREALCQLHLLSQQNPNDTKVTPIVLCGQESLFDMLRYPSCKPIMSRVLDGFNLRSMSNEECNRYIQHQICNIAGGRDDLFDDLSMKAIYQASGGIPRKINSICLNALQKTLENQQTSVCADVIREVTRNWWEE